MTPRQRREAERLYETGLSIRRVSEIINVNRESIRKHLVSVNVIRGRLAYHGDATERVMYYVDVRGNDECWPWLGQLNNQGYGLTCWNGQTVAAHRVVYRIFHFAIPTGIDACHSCDNPQCVNPNHIRLGTRTDNMRDAIRKGRVRRGEQSATSILTEAQIKQARNLINNGISVAEAARRVNAPYKTLHQALRGKTWIHLRESVQ